MNKIAAFVCSEWPKNQLISLYLHKMIRLVALQNHLLLQIIVASENIAWIKFSGNYALLYHFKYFIDTNSTFNNYDAYFSIDSKVG